MNLRRDFYARPTLEVARDLIGKLLVHRTPAGTAAGRIVEVEAYIGEDDPACHAAAGRTPRNEPLYGPPGLAYVYLSYGLHHLVNAVTESDGFPAAVLIRALEPVEGLALMRRRRARAPWRVGKGELADADLCRGPGNLTQALGITLEQNRASLSRLPLVVRDEGGPAGPLAFGSRIGISAGQDRPWRIVEAGSRAVSASRLTRSAGPGSG